MELSEEASLGDGFKIAASHPVVMLTGILHEKRSDGGRLNDTGRGL